MTKLESGHVFDGDGNPVEAEAELTIKSVDGVPSLVVKPCNFFARTIAGAETIEVNAADDIQIAIPLNVVRELLPPVCTCDDVAGCPKCFADAADLIGFTVRDEHGRVFEVDDTDVKSGHPTVCGHLPSEGVTGHVWATYAEVTVVAPPEGD